MFANRISSSTGCSIWPPETAPPSFPQNLLSRRFQSCNTSVQTRQRSFSRARNLVEISFNLAAEAEVAFKQIRP
jgi:hypothetical protein